MAKSKKDTRKFTDEQIAKAYLSFFDDPAGQIVLWDLRQRYFERTSLDPDGNPNKTIANEGRRLVVLYILSQIEIGEHQYGRRSVSASGEPDRAEPTRSETAFDPLES